MTDPTPLTPPMHVHLRNARAGSPSPTRSTTALAVQSEALTSSLAVLAQFGADGTPLLLDGERKQRPW